MVYSPFSADLASIEILYHSSLVNAITHHHWMPRAVNSPHQHDHGTVKNM